MGQKKLLAIGLVFMFSIIVLYMALLFSNRAVYVPGNKAIVARVIDGDTVELDTGESVRYIGIDAPETVHPTRGVECFGQEASDKNKELVEGKQIRLEKDISEIDRFGRLLRYVYVDDIFVNELLVKEGYATAVSYPPDVRYQDLFSKAEREARVNEKGLWAAGVCD